ncbi:phage major capsid protein [Schleiferiaceae bacterium]|nr:phage major capsid protein [Schleiferiaceae bacterium]
MSKNPISINKADLSESVKNELEQLANEKREFVAREERKSELIQMGEDRSRKNPLSQMARALVSGRNENRNFNLSGNTVTADNVQPIAESLKPSMVLAQSGVQVDDFNGYGDLVYPIETTPPTASYVAEGSGPSASDPTVTPYTAETHTATALVKVSRQLLASGNNVDEFIERSIANQVGLQMENAFFANANVTNAPTALSQVSGVTDIISDTNGRTLTNYDELVDLKKSLRNANANGKVNFYMSPNIMGGYAKLKDGNDQPLVPSTFVFDEFNEGYITSQIPNDLTKGSGTGLSTIFAFTPDAVRIAIKQNVVLRLDERYADELAVGMLAYVFHDIIVTRPSAVAMARGVKFA